MKSEPVANTRFNYHLDVSSRSMSFYLSSCPATYLFITANTIVTSNNSFAASDRRKQLECFEANAESGALKRLPRAKCREQCFMKGEAWRPSISNRGEGRYGRLRDRLIDTTTYTSRQITLHSLFFQELKPKRILECKVELRPSF